MQRGMFNVLLMSGGEMFYIFLNFAIRAIVFITSRRCSHPDDFSFLFAGLTERVHLYIFYVNKNMDHKALIDQNLKLLKVKKALLDLNFKLLKGIEQYKKKNEILIDHCARIELERDYLKWTLKRVGLLNGTFQGESPF